MEKSGEIEMEFRGDRGEYMICFLCTIIIITRKNKHPAKIVVHIICTNIARVLVERELKYD